MGTGGNTSVFGGSGSGGAATSPSGGAAGSGAPSGGGPSGGAPSGGGPGGGAPSGEAGTSIGSAGAGGGIGAALVGVFVAQGHEGRITRSCDDGKTFPYNDSADDSFRCFTDADHDCDHSALAGRGLAFGGDSFVATWGWGHPGKLQRSLSGDVFTDVKIDTPTFADVAYGSSRFVACGNPTWISADGQRWEVGGKLSFDFNYRGIEFVPTAGGKFIVTGESGDQRAISISVDGVSWQAATAPAGCASQLRGIAGSPSVMLIASALGKVCISDSGMAWKEVSVSDRFTSPPTWTGEEFWIYAGSARFKSVDGEHWTSDVVEPSNIAIGALARSPQGTWVAANDGWQVWYEKQHFYRSIDGQHWDALAADAFTGSHPINFISFGYVPASSGCGAP